VLRAIESTEGNSRSQNVVAILWQEAVPECYLSVINVAASSSNVLIIFPLDCPVARGGTVKRLFPRNETRAWQFQVDQKGLRLELAPHEATFLRIEFA
jgi:hypothetical protein